MNVPIASIAGMIISGIIAFGLPIFLVIYFHRKYKCSIRYAFAGAITFILSALVLEQLFHILIYTVNGGRIGEAINNSAVIRAVYGGLCAGIFEETGRYVTIKIFMKKSHKPDALMYGAGHGGIEAILLVGLSCISNIVSSILVNSGQAANMQNMLSPLWTTPSWQFYMSGCERISAIFLHISLSVIVYFAVKERKIRLFFIAIGIHAIVDAVTVYIYPLVGLAVLEIIVAIMVISVVLISLKLYKSCGERRPDIVKT